MVKSGKMANCEALSWENFDLEVDLSKIRNTFKYAEKIERT